jgi:hypothetical protein
MAGKRSSALIGIAVTRRPLRSLVEDRSAAGLRRDRPRRPAAEHDSGALLTSGSTAAPSVAAILQERGSLIAVIGDVPHLSVGDSFCDNRAHRVQGVT